MKHKWTLWPYGGLHKDIYIIFLARIVNSIGNFVMPFLTILLTDRLGLSGKQAGLFVMAAALAYATGSIMGGRLCDAFGRKKVLLVFQFLAAICLIPCAILGRSILLPWFLIASGFFGGAAGPSHTAMATDLTEGNCRKSALSLLYLGNNIGFAVGPMIAGFLYKNHLPLVFIGDALTTFISLVLVGLYVKETIPDSKKVREYKEQNHKERAEEGGLISVLVKRPMLLIFSAIMVIYSFVYAQYIFSLPIQINRIFGDNGPKFYGLLMTVNALTVVTLTPFITGLTLKIKPITLVIAGGIQYAAGFGMIFLIDSMPLFALSTILWTAGEVLVTTNSGVHMAGDTPVSHRGRFNGILPIITGIGYAFGPYITGIFIDAKGIENVWILTFVLSLGASILMAGLKFLSGHSEQYVSS